MKTLFVVLLGLFLSGCLWQSIDANDIETAQKICAKRGSTVARIYSRFDGMESVDCWDRTSHYIDQRSLGSP